MRKSLLLLVYVLTGMSLAVFAYAWTAPTQNPPSGGVPTPLNTGSSPQVKTGDFTSTGALSGGTVNATSSMCISGDCKTAWSQAGQWTTSGSNIYYAGGKINIGSSATPSYVLTVTSSTDALFGLVRTGATYPTLFKMGTDGALVVNNANADTITLKGGNVGVGTNNPSQLMHLYKASGDELVYGGNPRLYLKAPSGMNGLRIDAPETPLEVRNLTTGGPSVNINSSLHLTLTGANATAGVTTQNSNILYFTGNYWNGAASATAFQGSIYAKVTSAAANGGGLSLGGSGGADHMFIQASTGNVGIGTTNPGALLHVSGGSILLDNAQNIQFKQAGGSIKNIVRFDASNDLTFDTGASGGNVIVKSAGTEVFRANTSGNLTITGNVGIGTTAPSSTLHVAGSFQLGTSTTSGYVLTANSSGVGTWQQVGGGSVTTSSAITAGYFPYWANTTGGLMGTSTIYQSSGNIGIGTTGPAGKLDVSGGDIYVDTNNGLKFRNTSGYVKYTGAQLYNVEADTYDANGYFRVKNNTGANTLFLVQDNGNVGIGTTAPSSTLHVIGNGTFSGTVSVATPTATSHAVTKSYVDSNFAPLGSSWTSTSTGIYYSSGNVGIGTTTPADKLSIFGGGITGLVGLQDTFKLYSVNNAGALQFGGGPSSTIFTISRDNLVNSGDYNINTYKGLSITPGAGSNVVITSGNVGIGTTGPTQGKLVISGGDSAMLTNAAWKFYNSANDNYGTIKNPDGSTGSSLAFATNAEVMRITTNGNVGIGTTAPSSTLHVVGGVRATGASQFDSTVVVGTPTASGHAATKSYVDSAVGAIASSTYFAQNGNSFGAAATLGTNDTYPLNLEVGGATKLTVATSGNVGIGTASPGAPLQISSDSSSYGQFKIKRATASDGEASMSFYSGSGLADGSSWVIGSGAWGNTSDFVVGQGGVKVIVKNSSGNVGVGTTSPGTKLEVNGDLTMTAGGSNSIAMNRAAVFFAGNDDCNAAVYSNYSTSNCYNANHGSDTMAINGYNGIALVTRASGDNVRMYIQDSTGNVGVGTTGPTQKLDVAGSLVTQNVALSGGGAGGNRGSIYFAGAGDANHRLYNNYNNIDGEGAFDGIKWNGYAGFNFRVGASGGTSALFINSSANVGIGTTGPGQKLQVNGNVLAYGGNYIAGNLGYGQVGLGYDDGTYLWLKTLDSSRNLRLQANGSGAVLIADNTLYLPGSSIWNTSGNVGVGTTGPSYKLDVYGDIRSTGTIYANANGTKYLCGGDDACLSDVNIANTVGVTGVQNGGAFGYIKAYVTDPSSRDYKYDISSLSESDVNNLTVDLNNLDLKLYHLKSEDNGTAKHLGVIAEESPKIILSRPDPKGISQYDYTSMAIFGAKRALTLAGQQDSKIISLEGQLKSSSGNIQEQQQEMVRLKKENQELKSVVSELRSRVEALEGKIR